MRIEIINDDGTRDIAFVPIPTDTKATVRDSARIKVDLSCHFKCGGDADDEAETPGERAQRLDARAKRNAAKVALDARTVFRIDGDNSGIRSLVLGRDGPMVATGGTCCKLTPIGIVNLGETLLQYLIRRELERTEDLVSIHCSGPEGTR